jgi:tetratricopeptide (TPR) repeat protein
LVVAEDAPGGTRYRMLQTLADFARERLEARGGLDETRRRHALWVRDLAGTVQYGARTTGAIVAAVQDEDVAIRQAIDWALGTDPVLAVEICTRLVLFWTGTWRVSVGWELLSASLDAVRDRDPATRSFALSWGAFFSAMAHDMETSDRLADEALEFAQALGDPRSLGLSCLARSSAVTLQRRDLGEALRCLDEAAAHFRDARDEVGLGLVSLQSGDIRLLLGQPDAAQHDFAHAIATFRAGEQYLGLIAAVNWQGEYAWRRGDDELYGAMFRELLELGRQGRSAGVTAVAAARLTIGHLASGDLEAAREAAEEALASTSESFMPATNGFALRAKGLVDLRSDRIEDGRTSLREAIESFLRGSGGLGLGRAAECWLDLSRSYTMPGERAEAEDAARRAVELAVRAGDPWILRHAEEHLARLAT